MGITRNTHIDGLEATDTCYRAMGWLHEVKDDLERQVFDAVATLLNLEVDLLFFDTTSTYFELAEADIPPFATSAASGRSTPRRPRAHRVPDLPPLAGRSARARPRPV